MTVHCGHHDHVDNACHETSPLVVLPRVRARTTGRALSFPILQTVTVEDGRITEVHPFYWDTAAIASVTRR